jgi:hypothetical protein
MRMLDIENERPIRNLQLYLTAEEAAKLKDQLTQLLKDPEANEHFHLMATDSKRELSCSIVTDKKLKDISRYSRVEQELLRGE